MRPISVVALWAESMVIFWTMGKVDADGNWYFSRKDGFRHTAASSEAVLGVESQMQCSMLCVENPDCCAFSVSVTSEECRLSQHCFFSNHTIEASEGWNTFNKPGSRLCIVWKDGINYNTVRADAAPLCAVYGGVLASYEHLDAAFQRGWDMCSYGWFDGGVSLITQKVDYNCHSMIGVFVSERGVTDRYNVYCLIFKGSEGALDCSDI